MVSHAFSIFCLVLFLLIIQTWIIRKLLECLFNIINLMLLIVSVYMPYFMFLFSVRHTNFTANIKHMMCDVGWMEGLFLKSLILFYYIKRCTYFGVNINLYFLNVAGIYRNLFGKRRWWFSIVYFFVFNFGFYFSLCLCGTCQIENWNMAFRAEFFLLNLNCDKNVVNTRFMEKGFF